MSSDPHAAAYDAVAADFAERNAAMPPSLLEAGRELLSRLGERQVVLDLGCGPGRDMAWLEAAGAEAVGLDASPRMLELARARVRGSLVEGDMRSLPFAAAAFDGVWCIASLLHIPKAEAPRVLAEIGRVLVDGGPLVLSVKRGAGERWEAGVEGWPERFFARYEPAELTALVAGAGFSVDRLRESASATDRWLIAIATRGVRSRAAPGCP